MVWMLIGLPLASVVIGFALLFAAVHPGREDMETVEHVTKVGKLLVAAQDRADVSPVATTGLVLRRKGDMIEAVPMDGDFPRGGKLRLTLTSREPGTEGRVVQLSPSELGWRGVGSLDGGQDWLVELRPDNATWLLRGHWIAQARFVRLTP
jgi:hypothetical protein